MAAYLSVSVGALDVEIPVEVGVPLLVPLGAGLVLGGLAGVHAGHCILVRDNVQHNLVMVRNHISERNRTGKYTVLIKMKIFKCVLIL